MSELRGTLHTGCSVCGYELAQLADGSFLVPLLYPTAKKLAQAAQDALDKGYRLRLYDTYRPYQATERIYDLTAAIIYNPIPFRTYTGNVVSLPGIGNSPRAQILLLDLVQNNGWDLSSFLSNGGSYHNMGTAIDLEIEDAQTGDPLPAQTLMHDLSIYSTTYDNNDYAKDLFNIMESAGLKTIVSEWWHYQDNEAQNTLQLAWAYGGVSVRGWTFDGLGWRYRDASGRFIKDDITENGDVFFLDSDGYLEE